MSDYQWKAVVDELNSKLRLLRIPVGVKYFTDIEDLKKVERIRMPSVYYSPCMVVNQACQLGWTAACVEELVQNDYCKMLHGMMEKNDKYRTGGHFIGSWFDEPEQAKKHHEAVNCLPVKYAGFAASPLASGRIPEPDVCIMYMTPGQAFMLLAAWEFSSHETLSFSFAGESTCSDSWISTMLTGKPKIGLPCYAEQKFGNVKEEHLMVTMKPDDLCRAAGNLGGLYKNGLRYPIVSNGLVTDMWAPGGLPESYRGY